MRNLPLLLLAALFATSALAQPRSFQEVRDRVYAEPLRSLPSDSGFSAGNFAKALLGLANALSDRARGTITDPNDFKERAPKVLHPKGVCADATWNIDAESGATGLLAPGTRVNALVRLSTGDNNTEYKPGGNRVFGLAIKLFPSQDPNEKVLSRNVFTLDRYELDGNDRAHYLFSGSDAEPLYFWNHATGTSVGAKLAARVLGKFDPQGTIRPLYPVTEVTGGNQVVAEPRTPRFIQFFPRAARPSNSDRSANGVDFREELMAYAPGAITFDIALPGADDGSRPRRIGVLKLGQPVLSVVCDQELHFHHHPSR